MLAASTAGFAPGVTVTAVSIASALRIEVNGAAATAAQLGFRALVNYGHFTTMQARQGRARGLRLHLDRLDAATRELFGAELDGERVREYVRHALRGTAEATVRVDVFWPTGDDRTSIMVTLRAPVEQPTPAQRLRSVVYQRPVAHIKHVGGFGQIYFGRRAESDGFDDALLTDADGVISETTIANIGFFDGATLLWPSAPALHGITMRLLEPRLVEAGVPIRYGIVRASDLDSFLAVYVTNSSGVAEVRRIDDVDLPGDATFLKTVRNLYDSVPWEPI